jgi:hypothetical protein
VFDGDQVLHLLLSTVSWLHFGVCDVDGCLLSRAQGALRRHSISLILLVRCQQEDVAFVFVLLDNIRFDSLVNEVGGEATLATILVDERTRLRHLQAVAGAVVGVVRVVHGALRVQEVIDVRALSHLIDLIAVDDSLEVLLLAVQSESFRIAIHSILVVLLGEAVLVVPYGVPGHVSEDLDEPVLELDLAD